jgi:hypothetical protein
MTPDDEGRAAFWKVIQNQKARGFHPYLIAFLNDEGHARTVSVGKGLSELLHKPLSTAREEIR